MRIGIDIGSTTIKAIILDERDEVVFRSYERHYSQILSKTAALLQAICAAHPEAKRARIAVSGSAGMGLAEGCGLPFVQEVYATRVALTRRLPAVDAAIELGGEDAKILFLTRGLEVRMNGSCAGGTGAFIDQMATLLGCSPAEMNEKASHATRLYTIASRCGVFAKSDIQPLINQGVSHSDLAASIFACVVNQTIAGLAQGRPITGTIAYLGGPLTFLSGLRESFDSALETKGISPEDALYYVAIGAALCCGEEDERALGAVLEKLAAFKGHGEYHTLRPLFTDREQYAKFQERHARNTVERTDPAGYSGRAFVGIDAGSTTLKIAVIDEEARLLADVYRPNQGNPIPIARGFLEEFLARYPQIAIAGSASTGYGEDLVKNAFALDDGIVETVAHLNAAQHFLPDVEFIIDIGGQDIKCFKIKNGAIDSIFLNEACSSGCGSFLQTFANALGYSSEDFARLGLFAEAPVDLGSRCTVFMNSSVKQAQKDGATIENISAGLSISVVKNALYKVIRASSPGDLGRRIVVQGGTFLNDAVLRAFEQELSVEAVRPAIAGLMGAFGAALHARAHPREASSMLRLAQLRALTHVVKDINCGLCANNCRLSVNTFSENRRYISGNRCERPITKRGGDETLNLYAFKQRLLQSYQPLDGPRGRIGLPMGLNFYELLPFWHTFFSRLGFSVVTSPFSTRGLYLRGQGTIPSDTVCFPAKLMHGHVLTLLDMGLPRIFYPCMSYNLDEELGDNHFNCPVVAYYPQVIGANIPELADVDYIQGFVGLHQRGLFAKKIHRMLLEHIPDLTRGEVEHAAKAAFEELIHFQKQVRRRGSEIIARARREGRRIVVLAGRPYHVDPEVNHGIDQLLSSFGVAVVSEEVLSARVHRKVPVQVLNQWTYHARLYAAASVVLENPDLHLIQLVSFGCGIDAITTDEIREMLEEKGRLYTQLKIDEITNLGAVKIRLRSLFAAIDRQAAAKEGNDER